MAIWPGKDPSPFVETQETTSGPATMIGQDRVAFFMGNPPQLNLAIATTDGRIVTRMARVSAGNPITLAASPDGATLYYSEASAIWAVDVASGVPRRFHAGDAAVVDPRTGDLIVQLNESPDTVLVRMPAAGGEPRKVFERTGIGVAPDQGVAGNAILPDGRVLVTATQSDSWFWAPAVLDVRDGKLTRVPVLYDGDVNPSVWGKDGSILSIGWGLKTDIWRFRPMPGDGGATP
jgi:hypothetical protein